MFAAELFGKVRPACCFLSSLRGARCFYVPTLKYKVTRRDTKPLHNDRRNSEGFTAKEVVAKVDMSFSNGGKLYAGKTTLELVRALIVYRMCAMEWFVRHNQKLMTFGRRALGQRIFNRIMKMSMYSHFVSGENPRVIESDLKRMMNHGANSMLYFCVEEDIHDSELRDVDPDAKYDENTNEILRSIEGVKAATGGRGCIAVKPTALGPAEALAEACEVLINRQSALMESRRKAGNSRASQTSGLGVPIESMPIVLTAKDLREDGEKALFQALSAHYKTSSLTEFQWSNCLVGAPSGCKKLSLTESGVVKLQKLMNRAERIVKFAQDNGIGVMIDAEHSYYQAAIHRALALELMYKFNRNGKFTVWNTYQSYLKMSNAVLCSHQQLANQEGFAIGVRCVRGAYMEMERELSHKRGYEDPVLPTYEATTASYLLNVDLTLNEMRRNPDVYLMVATHDEDTVKETLKRLEEVGGQIAADRVKFAQLLGMADHLTFSLGQAGFDTYKSTPYGPVHVVMKYLGRRAIENSGVFPKMAKERGLLRRELKRRCFGRS